MTLGETKNKQSKIENESKKEFWVRQLQAKDQDLDEIYKLILGIFLSKTRIFTMWMVSNRKQD